MCPFYSVWLKEALPGGGGGGGSRVACLNFKMSHVGIFSVLRVAVGN